jgi:hypothetical protein
MTVPVFCPSGLHAGPCFGETDEGGSNVRSSVRGRISGASDSPLHQPENRRRVRRGGSIFSRQASAFHDLASTRQAHVPVACRAFGRAIHARRRPAATTGEAGSADREFRPLGQRAEESRRARSNGDAANIKRNITILDLDLARRWRRRGFMSSRAARDARHQG